MHHPALRFTVLLLAMAAAVALAIPLLVQGWLIGLVLTWSTFAIGTSL